jgi:DNA-directed RNA polymerase subunit beta'
MTKVKQKTFFLNKIITKKYLKEILFWSFRNYGMARAAFLADSLKKLGFHFSTQAGISISIEDLKIPQLKNELIEKTNKYAEKIEFSLNRAEINEVERYEQLTYIWSMASEKLKDEIINYFKNADPLNSIYMMAFSGARGNLSQVRQLVGMRGLMAGPSGEIIDIPITKNFREGLSITDYMIAAYGARKGLVDTALKTADSGYLTRRLIDVAQDILIRETDCYTKQGIFLFKLIDKQGKTIELKDRIIGRILAKDIVDKISKNIIAKKNQQINPLLAKKIDESNSSQVIIRSPLTCELSRSICKNCYGWNLSNGKLVDLGEAVGIVAAQSIGEPGTQLTMRTFHTGGIFTSDSINQIFSKVSGQVLFSDHLKTSPIRTSLGKIALVVKTEGNIQLFSFKKKIDKIDLNKNTVLFINDKEFIKKDQIIASLNEALQEYEKVGKKMLSSNVSGEIFFNRKLNNINLNKDLSKKSINRLIWVLSGKVFDIPYYLKITKYKFFNLKPLNSIGSTKLISYKGGVVKTSTISNKQNNHQIQLLFENFTIKNSKIFIPNNQNKILSKSSKNLYIFSLNENQFFRLTKKLKFTIEKTLTIGKLINTNFKTKFSGIIYFLRLKTNRLTKKFKPYEFNINQGGGICYLAEETFIINKDISDILVKNGSWIESNTELVKNVFNKNPGFVKITFTNNIVNTIIVKSGYLINLPIKQVDLNFHKKILFKGEKIFNLYEIKQLTYIEIIKNSNNTFLFIRPVFLYELPRIKPLNKNFLIKSKNTILDKFNYTSYKNKDRVILRNNNFVNLINTELIITINNNLNNLKGEFSFLKMKKNDFSLECDIFENIFYKNDLPKEIDSAKLNISLLIKNNQYIEPYTVIGNINFSLNLSGKINNLKEKKQFRFRRLLINLPENYKVLFKEEKNKIIVTKNFITSSEFITNNLLIKNSGIIKETNINKLTIHLANPFLFSEGAHHFWYHTDFVKKNENLGIIFYTKTQTGDIIQGLPKIEEILEARKAKIIIKMINNPGLILNNLKKRLHFSFINRFGVNLYSLFNEYETFRTRKTFRNIAQPINSNKTNPHNILKHLNYSYKKFLNPYQAAYRSLRKTQCYLLNAIQGVYLSQDIPISDKHVEIIVKQITSKIKVKNRGDSGIFNGEYIDLKQIYNMNKVLKKTHRQEIIYEPVLLGITKASLTNESFISSSSFQETVRILSKAAILGKADWLRGLKENVIVGRLIPSGTGFNAYEQISYLTIRLPKVIVK